MRFLRSMAKRLIALTLGRGRPKVATGDPSNDGSGTIFERERESCLPKTPRVAQADKE